MDGLKPAVHHDRDAIRYRHHLFQVRRDDQHGLARIPESPEFRVDLCLGPDVDPNGGLDGGAKAEIYTKLRALRDAGQAVLIISSDLEEVMAISDRIAIMVNGRLEAIHDAGAVSREQIVAEIGGD